MIFLLIGLIISAIGIWCFVSDIKSLTSGFKCEEKPTTPFSVSEYLSRIEKSADAINREVDKQEKYFIVLWWGMDGLKLNEDGTTGWIKKHGESNTQFEAGTIRATPLSGIEHVGHINGGLGGYGASSAIRYAFPLPAYFSPYLSYGRSPYYGGSLPQFQPYSMPQYMGVQKSIQALESQIQSMRLQAAQQTQSRILLNAVRDIEGRIGQQQITGTWW